MIPESRIWLDRCGRSRTKVAAISLVSAIALLVFGLLHRGTWIREIRQVGTRNSVQAFAGVVTDTVCAATRDPAKQTAGCVRACVQRPGVKYALYDGSRSYVISDQIDAAKLAARHVIIRGKIDTRNAMLLVRSIQERGHRSLGGLALPARAEGRLHP